MRREKTQIRNSKGEITTNTMEIQGIIRDYFEKLYSNTFENLEEINKFLDTYDHPKLNQEDINHLNRSMTRNEIEAAIKSLPKNKSSGPDGYCLTHSIKSVLHSSQNQTKIPPKRRTIGQSP
jgi:hypothetical protein